jgi:hypothetical protein
MLARLSVAVLLLGPAVAHADDDAMPVEEPGAAPSPPTEASCLDELDRRGITYQRTRKKGVEIGVDVTGPLGGITWTSSSGKTLLLDCSLAISLDEAGRYLADLGITDATFSSSYSVRNVRGSKKPSKHSYALAIDVHTFSSAELGKINVALDYEQGLGDGMDCIGQPLTAGGAILKTLQCQLTHSGLFRLVLSPDYDDAHHDHFHLEARKWAERTELRAATPAIH